MSVENGKVCCNCRHCIRSYSEKYEMIECRCEISGEYLGYVRVMEDRCKHWAKEKEENADHE